MRLIIVNADPIVQISLSSLVAQLGHSLTCIRSSISNAEGMPEPPEPAPDLLLIDGWEPGPNGIRVLRRMHGLYPATPIIVIVDSGSAVPPAKEAIDNGVYAYLRKPFSFHELELLIRRLTE